MTIPPNRQWVSSGRSDITGSMWSSFNLNLAEQAGKLRVSPRMLITTNGISLLGTPTAFKVYGGDVYAMAAAVTPSNAGIFQCTGGILTTAFTVNTGTGSGATNFSCDYSDLEIFNNKLFATGSGTDLIYGDGVGFTTSGSRGGIITMLTGSANHKLLSFLYKKRLYVFSSLTQILSLSSAFSPKAATEIYTLNIATATASSDLFLVSMIQTSNLIWILTANFYNNECYVYTWDGETADTLNSAYRIDARGALAGIVKDGTPYVIDTDGRLLYFNGSAFIPAPNGQLPIKQFGYLTNPISQKNDRWIHPNGITIVDGRINILINNLNHDNASTINENIASGIWEYDPTIGWYHKNALTQYDYSAGTPAITDYGQNRISRVGALFNLKKDDRSGAGVLGTMLAGADYYTDATTTKSAIFTNDSLDTLQKYGYIVTSKILSTNVEEVFNSLIPRLRPLLNSTDRVVVKYRNSDKSPVEATITWVNSTSFTVSTATITDYDVGDEVEGISGGGAGKTAHIVSKTDNAGTSTVVIDETLGQSAAATAKARFQHWKKAGTLDTQTVTYNEFSLGNDSAPWVQLKICMLFTGDNELYDSILNNTLKQ